MHITYHYGAEFFIFEFFFGNHYYFFFEIALKTVAVHFLLASERMHDLMPNAISLCPSMLSTPHEPTPHLRSISQGAQHTLSNIPQMQQVQRLQQLYDQRSN